MLRVRQPSRRSPERTYVLDVLLREFLGLDWAAEDENRDDVEITLRDGSPGRLVLPDVFLSVPDEAWLRPESLPPSPVAEVAVADEALAARLGERALPCILGDPTAELLSGSPPELRLGVDVLGGSFFMLTRYEELVLPDRDEHERFPSAAALAVRSGFAERPVVNEYAELLWTALSRLWPRLSRRRRTFAVLPSHDVDWYRCTGAGVATVARAAVGDLVLRRDPLLAGDRLASFARIRRGEVDADLGNVFDFLMDASERRGLVSAFYFITERTVAGDGDYDLDEPAIRRLLRRIHERGHEVGLHPSYETFRDSERTRRQRERLAAACEAEGIEQPRWGGRQHFLRWENPTTWQSWADAGLDYDSTLGFSDRAGFRCGTCYEFPVFNLLTRKQLPLRERPLVVMELTLFGAAGTSAAEAQERAARLRERCRRFDGEFTLLWHNSRLVSRRERSWYLEALDA